MKSVLLALCLVLGPAPLLAANAAEDPQPDPIPAARDVAYPGALKLEVDATDIDRRIFRVRQSIPVSPGPLTLLYPEWLPGNHAPKGPIDKLGGLMIRANGQSLAWTRDPVNVFAFHLVVPAGVSTLEAEFQFLSPTAPEQGRVMMTPEMLNLQWNAVALYPAGYFARRIPVEPSVRLPAGWAYGTALEATSEAGGLVRFKPVDLDTLVDSPIFAGRYARRYDLDTSGRSPVRMHIVADRPELLAAQPDQIERHRELVRQADRLFGARHFDRYEFLVALTDRMGDIGLEHHRSSENATETDYFTDWAGNAAARNLLPHEYAHSWSGKFRRPAGLATPEFSVPMRNDLLWMYEGQDQYWGFVLGVRSGLVTRQQTLDALAMTAALYSSGRPGRAWRSVEDTTRDPIAAARRPQPWISWQRSEDYYSEGQLAWLDIDTLIRERSGGRRSLDDFARVFFGMDDGVWTPRPYTFEDIVAALDKVQPYDWAGFLRARLQQVAPTPPLDGLTRGGYRLAYAEQPTDYWRDSETRRKVSDLTYSLGLTVTREGRIAGVLWDGPAFKAGLTASDQVLAVNGVAFDPARLKEAITAAKGGKAPIDLIIRDGDHFRVVAITYGDGLRYPRLERIPGKPDLISRIYEPLK